MELKTYEYTVDITRMYSVPVVAANEDQAVQLACDLLDDEPKEYEAYEGIGDVTKGQVIREEI